MHLNILQKLSGFSFNSWKYTTFAIICFPSLLFSCYSFALSQSKGSIFSLYFYSTFHIRLLLAVWVELVELGFIFSPVALRDTDRRLHILETFQMHINTIILVLGRCQVQLWSYMLHTSSTQWRKSKLLCVKPCSQFTMYLVKVCCGEDGIGLWVLQYSFFDVCGWDDTFSLNCKILEAKRVSYMVPNTSAQQVTFTIIAVCFQCWVLKICFQYSFNVAFFVGSFVLGRERPGEGELLVMSRENCTYFFHRSNE